MIAKACVGLVKLRNDWGGSEMLGKCSERFIHRSQVLEYTSRARCSSSVFASHSVGSVDSAGREHVCNHLL